MDGGGGDGRAAGSGGRAGGGGRFYSTAFSAPSPGWLEHLYIDPAHQGRGVGSRLLAGVRTDAARPVRLWVFQRNLPARRFYERHGATLIQTTDGHANEEREPDALYELPEIP